MEIMRPPKLFEMFDACENNVVVLTVSNYHDDTLEERLITLDPNLVSDDVHLLQLENREESISVGYWTHTPRTFCHMGVDWRLQ